MLRVTLPPGILSRRSLSLTGSAARKLITSTSKSVIAVKRAAFFTTRAAADVEPTLSLTSRHYYVPLPISSRSFRLRYLRHRRKFLPRYHPSFPRRRLCEGSTKLRHSSVEYINNKMSKNRRNEHSCKLYDIVLFIL